MKIMGVDASSNSFAYGILDDEKLVEYGEIFFKGEDLIARLKDARLKLEAILPKIEGIDAVAFEEVVMVRSIKTASTMAKMFGVILSILAEYGATIYMISPTQWQSAIGNPNISKQEARRILQAHPEVRTASQQSKFIREYRKNVTKLLVKQFYDVEVSSDNESDAIALAHFLKGELDG